MAYCPWSMSHKLVLNVEDGQKMHIFKAHYIDAIIQNEMKCFAWNRSEKFPN